MSRVYYFCERPTQDNPYAAVNLAPSGNIMRLSHGCIWSSLIKAPGTLCYSSAIRLFRASGNLTALFATYRANRH